MIVMSRIDDRLIHGQVVEGWVNYLKATRIIVVDDRVASNLFQRTIMELSAPQDLRVTISRVEDICEQVSTMELTTDRVILLFSNPADVLRAINSGLNCRVLNIGGMHYVLGKRKLLDVLAVDDADLDALKELAAKGVKVDVQTVPNQRAVPLEKIFAACHV